MTLSLHHLAVGTICPGEVRMEFMQSTIAAQNAGADVLIKPAGPYLDMERNEIVRMFMAGDKPWLVFIDADVYYQPHDLLTLTAHPDTHPFTSGVYFNVFGTTGHAPVLYDWRNDDKGAKGMCLITNEVLESRERDEHGFITVDAAGAGMLAIHRSVLEQFQATYAEPQPWFSEQVVTIEETGEQRWHGEDFMFCMRAKLLGHTLRAHPDVLCIHFKTMPIGRLNRTPAKESA
jgi:hypothetical protein